MNEQGIWRWFVMEGPLNAPWEEHPDGEQVVEVVNASAYDAAIAALEKVKRLAPEAFPFLNAVLSSREDEE